MSGYAMDLQEKFYRQLDEIFDQVQKSEHKTRLPYGKPMNLTPIVSSAMFVGATSIENKPKKINLESVVVRYGVLKDVLVAVSQDISLLNTLEAAKREYVKKRENVRFQTGLTDFEKRSKERELQSELKKIKEGISQMSKKIDKRMDNVTKRIVDLSKIKRYFERKHSELIGNLDGVRNGTISINELPENMSNHRQLLKDRKEYMDGITMCDQIITKAKERKDYLNKKMWMETQFVDKGEIDFLSTASKTENNKGREI